MNFMLQPLEYRDAATIWGEVPAIGHARAGHKFAVILDVRINIKSEKFASAAARHGIKPCEDELLVIGCLLRNST